jgi:hypothetical protein
MAYVQLPAMYTTVPEEIEPRVISAPVRRCRGGWLPHDPAEVESR